MQSDWTPLHEASQRGHKDIVDILISNGGDIYAKNKVGKININVIKYL